jgi:D-alanine-D-alanine ligase
MRKKKKLPLNLLALTFNLRRDNVTDKHEEYDDVQTVYSLKEELGRYASTIVLLEQDEDIFKNIRALKPDYVFNICEGLGASRSREGQLPSFLEMIDIPFFGSDAVSLSITLDKYLANIILKNAGIATVNMHLVNSAQEISNLRKLNFLNNNKYIVKPRWEGSSKGIFNASVAATFKECKKLALKIIRDYKQPAIVEDFLGGSEITLALAGNEKPQVLGMMKIEHRAKTNENFIYSLEVKRNWRKEIDYLPESFIDSDIKRRIQMLALKAFKAFELRDIARIDFRLDDNGKPKIIDINPLPGLSPVYSDLPILFSLKKKSYSRLIDIIMTASLKRYGFIK